MKHKNNNNYILFWVSQSVSQLGSSMTSFALVIWVYKQTNSAMTVSLLTFFTYLPFIAASIWAGAFIDTHKKKPIMLWADSIASACSVTVLILFTAGELKIWCIYAINIIIGFMNAFQSPASAVSTGILVPKEEYSKVSGMNSFSNSLITAVTPMLAASISSFCGLGGILYIDIASFCFAFITLLVFIKIPEPKAYVGGMKPSNIFSGCKEGFVFLSQHRGLLNIIFSMAILNFFSNLTYENILPPMILSRSGGNNNALGIVSGVLGVGGILGGIIVSFAHLPADKIKLIYFPAAFSFLFGDLLMGIGQNTPLWIAAALAASMPISLVTAGQNVLMYNLIPQEIQGRVFSFRNAVQYFTIPLGTLLGGALADFVFEPFMKCTSGFPAILHRIVGNGSGSGMAVMFLCTGVLGFISSILWYNNKQIRLLQQTL